MFGSRRAIEDEEPAEKTMSEKSPTVSHGKTGLCD